MDGNAQNADVPALSVPWVPDKRCALSGNTAKFSCFRKEIPSGEVT